MKRRAWLIGLVLAMVLTALAPATVSADNSQRVQGGSFTGSGQLYVTYMPDPLIKGQIWRYRGEVAEGFLEQCDWSLLAPTVFYSKHDSTVRVDDAGNTNGVMTGTFSLTRPDGTGILKGTFTGRINGNLLTGDISDQGTWVSTGGTGVFQGVRAWGSWSAELHFGIVGGQPTLVGPVNWNGKYIGLKEIKDRVKEEIGEGIKEKIRANIEGHVKENVKEKILKNFRDRKKG